MDVEYSVVRGMNKYCIGWIYLLSIIDEPVNEDKKQFLIFLRIETVDCIKQA